MTGLEDLRTLELLGSGQWNLVTAQQALSVGVTRNRLTRFTASGVTTRVRSGVYALSSSEHGPLQDLRAAWLATDPKKHRAERALSHDLVVVTGISAASVHGLGELIPLRHEFSAPSRRQSSLSDVRFHHRTLRLDELRIVEGLPVTSVVKTVSDVASSLHDYDHLAQIVRDALEHPEVFPSDLVRALSRYADRYGNRTAEDLFSDMVRTSSTAAKFRDFSRFMRV